MSIKGFHAWASQGNSAIATLRVRGALVPVLWILGMSLVSLVPAAYMFRDHLWLPEFFALLIALVTLISCGAFVYLLIRSPEKLQSEDYQLKHSALSVIGAHGDQEKLGHEAMSDLTNTFKVILARPTESDDEQT